LSPVFFSTEDRKTPMLEVAGSYLCGNILTEEMILE
jgi:hypothetical protein